MSLLPKTTLGKWSVGLIIAFFLLLATGIAVVSVFKQEGGETFFDNLWISIPMLGAGAAAIAAFIVGIIAIIKNKERSILVIIAALIGLLVSWFVVGEIVAPH
ncbi:MAG: hypothetical protein A2Z42_03635 [Candidatus Woykebacteria bacterium RBG_19FT_COMBO_43_10]|uniref:Major facilitator superfamily (MFS) profile domain-containing protein n=1 Tax=Candidatus Woykebacteria bacterium RBG_19FT_COMBO_43_10 TaxID=1802598 RepID=A0A1G1WI29_9BACT|nr:MAG: hypothetical protein A2Z42_03635 [Candidatus Woykebacteria bacterium RBG_19FT_COMBO_43_10]